MLWATKLYHVYTAVVFSAGFQPQLSRHAAATCLTAAGASVFYLWVANK